jgi:hypothetical protein
MEAPLDLIPGRLHLFVAPRPIGYRLLNACIARMALAEPICVLDGGNGFDVHSIARGLRAQTAELDAAMQRITIARAFTCYQVVALLAQQPLGSRPVLVLDLLATFHDENVPRPERLRLLDQALGNLVVLSRLAPVAISVSPSAQDDWLARLETTLAAQTCHGLARWRFEAPPVIVQPRLF